MKLCPCCDRHLFGPEPACPFCGTEQLTIGARPSGALASVALVLGLGAAACGPIVEPDQTNGSSSVDDATSSPPISTSTTVATTVDTTTTDGPAMTSIQPESSSDDSDDNPCAFYAGCPPDGGDRPPYYCHVIEQDCPDGFKCMPWADDGGDVWNSTRCVPIDPDPGAPGDPCVAEGGPASGFDDCELGAMCFDVDPETNQGTCVAMCVGSLDDPQCEDPEQTCVLANGGVLALCMPSCDPLAPACEDGEACYPSPSADGFACFAIGSEKNAYGDPCEFVNACIPGHTCLEAASFPACAGEACCTPFCDAAVGEPCPEAELGVVCEPWYAMGTAPPGYEDVGVCVLPS